MASKDELRPEYGDDFFNQPSKIGKYAHRYSSEEHTVRIVIEVPQKRPADASSTKALRELVEYVTGRMADQSGNKKDRGCEGGLGPYFTDTELLESN